ncbi:MAG: RidA family protein [Nevskiales bacterium]
MKTHIGKLPQLASGVRLPLSRAVRAGEFLFLSGQLGVDGSGAVVAGGIEAQTRQALNNIGTVLGEAGASPSDVVRSAVWLTDRSDFAAFNRVYAEYFGDTPPARSTVVSDLVLDGALVEIEVTAYLAR